MGMYLLETKKCEAITQALTTRTNKSVTISKALPLDRSPAAVYLARFPSEQSRRTMQTALNNLAALLRVSGSETAPAFLRVNWAALRYPHTPALRTRLMETYAPATANKHLAALRGVLKECWRLQEMTADDYQRAVDIADVKNQTLPKGRDIGTGEMLALVDACLGDADRNGQP